MRASFTAFGFAACIGLICFQSADSALARTATDEVQQMREGVGRSKAWPAGTVILAMKGVGGRDAREQVRSNMQPQHKGSKKNH